MSKIRKVKMILCNMPMILVSYLKIQKMTDMILKQEKFHTNLRRNLGRWI